MDYPTGQLASIPANIIDSAVYINSITYGRLGILTLETNYSASESQERISSIFKTIFSSGSTSFTKEEQAFLNGCDFKVYLIGGNSSTSVESFHGLTGFINHIKKGNFSRDVPGLPLFCTFNHVKDNSPVSVNFQFSVKKEPIYVELTYKPLPQPNPNISGSSVSGYGELYLYFYRNAAKVPTIPHPAIKFKLQELVKSKELLRPGLPTKPWLIKYNHYEYQNAGYQTSLRIQSGIKLIVTQPPKYHPPHGGDGGDWDDGWTMQYEYSLEKSNDYVILGHNKINSTTNN